MKQTSSLLTTSASVRDSRNPTVSAPYGKFGSIKADSGRPHISSLIALMNEPAIKSVFFWELRDIYQFKCSRPRSFASNGDGSDIIGEPRAHFYRLAIACVPRVEFASAHFTLQGGQEAPGLGSCCRLRMKERLSNGFLSMGSTKVNARQDGIRPPPCVMASSSTGK